MSTYSNRVTVPAAWGNGWDCGFVPRGWRVRLTTAGDGPIEVSFDGKETTPTISARVGPSTATLPDAGTVETSGRSRIFLQSAAGGETVDIEAWS